MRAFSLPKKPCLGIALSIGIWGCGGAMQAPPSSASPPKQPEEVGLARAEEAPREPPPPSGPTREVRLPPIARSTLSNGLELNLIRESRLPLVYVRLILRSGLAKDPKDRPGLSLFLAKMLELGTRRRSSQEIAEAIEGLGADFSASVDSDSTTLEIRGLAEHLDTLLSLLAELAIEPSFPEEEIKGLKIRESNRLAVEGNDPSYITRREIHKAVFGEHPYAHIDLSLDSIERLSRRELVEWHRTHYVPNNSFIVVVGDIDPERARALIERNFGRWRKGGKSLPGVPEFSYQNKSREILLVHRPNSVQSVIAVAAPVPPPSDPASIPFEVANQILGGSVSSRLFLDLRERRGLTYGAYSSVDERVQVSLFRARLATPTAQTVAAMEGLFEHLERFVREPPTSEEVKNASRYLSDSFPLQIDTFGRLAWMVAYLRLFNLPDDHWDRYRQAVLAVKEDEAFQSARRSIDLDRLAIVVVGDGTKLSEPLRRWGSLRLVSA
ncbi:MAG: insulinase family protein, partial [Deltaproteobacteria bacterium]|nr:insulinase family protein [Deltaproteobacteria bacterium]